MNEHWNYNRLYIYPKTVWRYRFNPFGEREQKRMYQSPLGDTNEEFYPWVYYLLGIDNRQHATYYGVQSNDNGVLSDDNWSQIPRLDPMRPMTFFYPAEYNVYGNEQAPRITYRYVDGNWQKQFKFYDYLGSLRFTIKAGGTLLNFKQYAAFGETTLDTLGVTRQGYIGKEKDVENNLGDHGVRKYDYETGRFNSIDPLWEKYYGWTPYQYCMNNPIWAKDWDGKDIYLLTWTSGGENGPGHSAIGVDNYGDKKGTVTVYDLTPKENVGITNATSNVGANYRSADIDKSDIGNLDYKSFRPNPKGDNPDGVLSISTKGKKDDDGVRNNLVIAKNENYYYNGVSWNCSHYPQEGLRYLNPTFGAFEYFNISYGINLFKGLSVTPNFLFRKTKEVFDTKTIKDPGNSVYSSFPESVK